MKAIMFCAAYVVGFAALVCNFFKTLGEAALAITMFIYALYCLAWFALVMAWFAILIARFLMVSAIRVAITPRLFVQGPA